MASDIPAGSMPPAYTTVSTTNESAFSGVSWAAIIAGGVAGAALAAILSALGAGLGLLSVSPWPGEGASAATIGAGVIIWSILVEVAAFGLGGYLAGRLRTKWASLHGDEVYFRDTAHGLVTWALGTLIGIALVSSAAGHLARGGAEAGAAVATIAGGAAAGGAGMVAADQGPRSGPGAMRGNPMDYYLDMLFRPAAGAAGAAPAGSAAGTTATTTTGNTAAVNTATPVPGMQAVQANNPPDLGPVRAEIARIVATSFKDGDIALSAPDKSYIAGLIAQRTGLSQQDAEKRIDDVIGQAKAAMADVETKARQAADAARHAGAILALWWVVSMLIGAFAASYGATIGGRHRDIR
jgi:hypothetical protein